VDALGLHGGGGQKEREPLRDVRPQDYSDSKGPRAVWTAGKSSATVRPLTQGFLALKACVLAVHSLKVFFQAVYNLHESS